MNFTKEQIEKAMACTSVDELLELAKAENVPMSKEEAEAYLAQLNNAELTPADIEDIVGGCIENVCVGNISAGC